ncbi:MAG: acylphosphatase [Verrucomicrobiales bacterium]|nr:acylphosphatase [Verrucomicrobiales bacterium]
MNRARLVVYFAGRVQGVGFRYTTKNTALGFEVIGTVRNLADGRVELIAEGARQELEDFLQAVRDAGLGRFIKGEEIRWENPTHLFKGFEIVS